MPEISSDTTPEWDLDALFDVLGNWRRRQVLLLLDERSLTLDELADEIAAIEFGSGYDSKARKSVYVALYQTHLPNLVENGVATILEDERHGPFAPGPNHAFALDALADARAKMDRGGPA